MQIQDQTEIKRRPDGSIDTAHYMKIGRQMRSEQAHSIAKSLTPKAKPRSKRMWFGWAQTS